MNNIRIALAVFQAHLNDVESNLDNTLQFIIEAKQKGADIICFPEMNLTGYSPRENIKAAAQSIPGPVSQHLLQLADREQIAIMAGLAEIDNHERLFASHLIALPQNKLHIYRKIHLAPPEKEVFSYGDAVSLFHYRGTTIGTQLCYDAHFPELTTRMALKGADLIFFPHASPRGTPKEKINSWMRHLTARAFDNGVFVAACNQTGNNINGSSFPGVALVIGPSGEVLAQHDSGKEGLLVVDLKADMLTQVRQHPMRYFIPNRRPKVYDIF
jgi:predicted amidohydrolase